MIQRIVAGVVALVAMAVAVGTAVVAAAFALYAVLKPYLTEAGASACVALAFALIAAIVALVMGRRAQGDRPRRRGREPEQSPTDRILELARQRPILAAAGALAAGIVALKNPQVVASIVTAMFAAKAADKTDRRR